MIYAIIAVVSLALGGGVSYFVTKQLIFILTVPRKLTKYTRKDLGIYWNLIENSI